MGAVNLVADIMKSLVAAHTKNSDVLEMADEVARIFVETSAEAYEGIDPKIILYDQTARKELYRRMVVIRKHGHKDIREGCSKFYQFAFAWRFKHLDQALNEFVRIVTVIYERNN